MPDLDLGVMQFDHVDAINNVDIIGLVAIVDAGLRQFSRCPSATQNNVHPADLGIAEQFIVHLQSDFDHFAGRPELYMPKASPKPKKLPTPPTVSIVENGAIQHLMYSLSELRTEMLFCEDADRSNGFRQQTTEVVITPWMEKFSAYVQLLKGKADAETWWPDSDTQAPGINPTNPR